MSVNITEEDVNAILDGTTPNTTSAVRNTAVSDNENQDEDDCGITENDVDIKVLSDFGTSAMITQRYSGAPWFENCLKLNVEIVGAGGISSWTALALSRLNLNRISIRDNDSVSLYNMAGQFYSPANVGGYKVHELANNIRLFSSSVNIDASTLRLSSDSYIQKNTDIVISGVDSMVSRRYVYGAMLASDYKGLYIDGRLSADTFQILCFRFDDDSARKRYVDNYMFDDSESDTTVCSYKQTTYMAMMIASVICNLVVNYANNKVNLVEYNIPFFTEYNSMMMSLEEKR